MPGQLVSGTKKAVIKQPYRFRNLTIRLLVVM